MAAQPSQQYACKSLSPFPSLISDLTPSSCSKGPWPGGRQPRLCTSLWICYPGGFSTYVCIQCGRSSLRIRSSHDVSVLQPRSALVDRSAQLPSVILRLSTLRATEADINVSGFGSYRPKAPNYCRSFPFPILSS